MEKKKTLIQSLDRALDILAIVRDSANPVRSTDIAEQLGLGVATAHNIIRSLYIRGYLAQDENSRYVLGPECFRLYREAAEPFEQLRKAAAPQVRELASATGDTTFFGVEYYGTLYCVSLSVGNGQLVVSGKQDWLDKLHSTAAGKVIIAEKGLEWFERIAAKQKFEKFTDRTLTTPAEMTGEIAKIKKSAYALSIDECSNGIAALGIPVYDKDGKFIGSLAQSFPTMYLENGKINPDERAKLLQSFARKITEAL